jgi:hypothetical protein
MESESGYRSRVVVLSDGHANRGIVEPGELSEHAEQLRIRGVSSSAIGIGAGYSALQLEAIAAAGGGRMHRADSASEIVEVLLGELEESQRTVADDVSVIVQGPAGTRLELVSAFPARQTPEGLAISAGSLAGGNRVTLIVRAHMRSGAAGETLDFHVRGAWTPAGADERRQAGPVTATIRLAAGAENDAQPRAIELSETVARAWQAAIVRRAVQLNREREYHQAQSWVETQVAHFDRYCAGLPGGAALSGELHALARRVAHEWDERSRQEVQLSSYKMSRMEREVRSRGPKSWAESMPPPGPQPPSRPR